MATGNKKRLHEEIKNTYSDDTEEKPGFINLLNMMAADKETKKPMKPEEMLASKYPLGI
jgi:hypothetical protein